MTALSPMIMMGLSMILGYCTILVINKFVLSKNLDILFSL